jgi:hypothetical protein
MQTLFIYFSPNFLHTISHFLLISTIFISYLLMIFILLICLKSVYFHSACAIIINFSSKYYFCFTPHLHMSCCIFFFLSSLGLSVLFPFCTGHVLYFLLFFLYLFHFKFCASSCLFLLLSSHTSILSAWHSCYFFLLISIYIFQLISLHDIFIVP